MNNRKIRVAAIVLGVTLLVGGGIWLLKRPAKQPSNNADVVVSEDEPSRNKPEDEGYVWRGAADEPRQIIMNSIGVKAFIQKVDVTSKQQVAAPSNIYLAGWFVRYKKPGERGLSIIDGHVVDQSDQGVFTRLGEMQPDDEFEVEFGDGSSRRFSVVETREVDVNKAEAVLFSQDPTILNQLNLITCGGAYNEGTRTFDKRVIVISKLLE